MATLEVASDIDNTLDTSCHAINNAEDCKSYLQRSLDFKVLLFNIRSHNCNFDKFLILLKRTNIQYDVIVLTECWLGKTPHVNTIEGYSHYHTSKYINQNGGVIVYIKTELQATVKEPYFEEADCLCINLSNNFTIIAIYRSPSFPHIANFLETLDKYLETLNQAQNIVLMGDININIMADVCSQNKTDYLCTTAEHGLLPLITLPTRFSSCLDHIFIKTKCQSEAFVCKTSICDHDLPMAFINTNTNTHYHKRQITKTDYNAVAAELGTEDWVDILTSQDVTDAANKFTDIIKRSIEKHTKIQTVSRSKFNYKPWITPGLIRCMAHRDRLHLKSRKSPKDATAKLIYTRYSNFCKDVLRKVKTQYETNLLVEGKDNPKKLWNAIKKICDITPKRNIATELIAKNKNPLNSLNNCNEYFATVGTSLADKIIAQTKKTESELVTLAKGSNTPNSSFFLSPTNTEEVSSYIKQLKNESAPGLDGINNPLLKFLDKHIVLPITHICNLSLSNGRFPEVWKTAVVTPIHKSGDKSTPINYRPISLLSVVSKLLEKIVNNRLVNYLEMNHLLSPAQFGFRRGRSTEHAVSLLLDKVATHLDQGKRCLGVFLDLAKAFDTVSIPILLQKLENMGIRGHTLNWFQSYLTNRKQLTKIGTDLSEPKHINYGVPQGSILGPTLFIIYMNDIGAVIPPSDLTETLCYADDTAILFAGDNWEDTYRRAEVGLAKTATWLSNNLLTLNISKTKYLGFHKTVVSQPNSGLTLKMHTCSNDFQIQTCSCEAIERVEFIKYLGVVLDEKVNFVKHIEYVSNRARKLIFVMRSLRNSANIDILRNVYTSLCESVLSYCITCWGGSSKTNMLTVERAQRSILKVMLKKPKRFPTLDVYQESRVLTVRQLFILRVCLLKHRETINSPDYPNLLQRRIYRVPVPLMKTKFSNRLPKFLHPYTYNQISKLCNLRQATLFEAKKIIKNKLFSMSYAETEDIFNILQ